MKSPLYIIAATAVLGLSAISYTAVAENEPTAGADGTATLRLLADYEQPDAPMDLRVGNRVDPSQLTLVAAPGTYGLSLPPTGNRYAIIAEHLVRIDPDDGKILSILRRIDPAQGQPSP